MNIKDINAAVANSTPLEDIQNADIVITIGRDGIEIIKNRYDFNKRNVDLAYLLELILPYQEKYLHHLLTVWIDKLKIYRLYS